MAEALVLRLEGLGCDLSGQVILGEVSLAVRPGEALAVLGHNGAGKSTLLRVTMGLAPLSRGRVELGGGSIGSLSCAQRWHHGLGYWPQGAPVFPGLDVGEVVRLAATRTLGGSPGAVYESFPQLEALAHQDMATLSGGERALLGVALALSRSPRILLLDEPFAGLSQSWRRLLLGELERRLRRGDLALLVVDHSQVFTELTDRVLVLRHGAGVYDGSYDALVEGGRLRELML